MRDPSVQAVGKRLALLRTVLDVENQVDMAKMLKIDHKRYHVWEVGKGLIPVPQAIEMRRLTGASLDYIYLGEMGGLSAELAKQLASLDK
jgi:hypothetical protein